MTNMHFSRCVLILVLSMLAGCGLQNSSPIAAHFSASGGNSVDLALAVPSPWGRVCILGPYSSDSEAAETLGFEWSAESLTDIASNESISLLIFVQHKRVMHYVSHPRRSGDFSNLSGRCFSRNEAKFVQDAYPVNGWAGLFPADES